MGPNSLYTFIIQSLKHVGLFVTLWTAAQQACLSFTISRRLLKLMSIESVKASNHLILCHPLFLLPSLFPSIRVFSNDSALHISWPQYWSFNSASVLPMNIQGWFPLGLTGLISLLSIGLFLGSSPAPQFEGINSSWLIVSLSYASPFTMSKLWSMKGLDNVLNLFMPWICRL